MSILLLIAAAALLAQPAAAAGSVRINFPPSTSGVVLGQGWNGDLGAKTQAVCIEFMEMGAGKGQTSSTTSRQVTSQRDMMLAMDLSASAQYDAIAGSAESELAYTKSVEITGLFQSYAVRGVVDNPPIFTAPIGSETVPADIATAHLRNLVKKKTDNFTRLPVATAKSVGGATVRLTAAYAALALNDPVKFKHDCGDSFVSALYTGAKMLGVLTFRTTTTKQAESISSTMSGSGVNWSAGGSAEQTMEDYKSDSELDLSLWLAGGRDKTLPQTPAGLIDTLGQLASLASTHPVDNELEVTSYADLSNWPTGRSADPGQKDYGTIIDYWGSYDSMYHAINYMGTGDKPHPDEFLFGRGVSLDALAGVQDQLQGKTSGIECIIDKYEASNLSGRRKQFCEPYHASQITDPPASLTKDPYLFRVEFPLHFNGPKHHEYLLSNADLKAAIGKQLIHDPAKAICRVFGSSAFGCLLNATIAEYIDQIKVKPAFAANWSWVGSKPSTNVLDVQIVNQLTGDCLVAEGDQVISTSCSAGNSAWSLMKSGQIKQYGKNLCWIPVYSGDGDRYWLRVSACDASNAGVSQIFNFSTRPNTTWGHFVTEQTNNLAKPSDKLCALAPSAGGRAFFSACAAGRLQSFSFHPVKAN
jgi:hypothetical protein